MEERPVSTLTACEIAELQLFPHFHSRNCEEEKKYSRRKRKRRNRRKEPFPNALLLFIYLPTDLKLYVNLFQLSRSNSREVTLTGVDRKTSGEYKCEVSADAPLFHTEIRAAHLLVADIPDEGPVLRTDILKVAPGATIKANCTTPGSYPPMNVTWFVNDVEVRPRNETEVLRIIERYEALPGLETVRSIYTMRVQQSMFKNGKVKLRCLATMFTLYRRTKEVELQEDAPLLALVMEPTPHGNKGYSTAHGLSHSNMNAYFWSIFTASCVMVSSRRFCFH